ncbi:dimeric dUTPase (all-alpha-NTP-PPase superfamily) [Lysinibacillus parviboronicapiens]|uniref:Dimeric dUTPase (All-alpha-NTP-PPase superfamily) n=1 Tax=Lysinibacillus parviboronicapiens TaxID=436516 RepID=A0ABV2PMN8_9BACI
MNLTKLFETQAKLDEHIMQEHPELRGQNNLDWKLLALQVELAECANEWRGFKKWSKDQEPRTVVYEDCKSCDAEGSISYHGNGSGEWLPCNKCEGSGVTVAGNPLLEEYVDCLHFILSIGLEIGYTNFSEENMNEYFAQLEEHENHDITGHFIVLNWIVGCIYENKIHYEQTLFELINLGEMLGFTWDEVEVAYFEKNKINHARQESGY